MWNPILYTFSHLMVKGTNLIYVPNATIYPPNTEQVHVLAQARTEYMFSPCAFTFSCNSLNMLLLKGSSDSMDVFRGAGRVRW